MTKKLTLHLRGGLGNQLFIYTAGLVISQNSKLRLRINTCGTDHKETIRNLILPGATIIHPMVTKFEQLNEISVKTRKLDLSGEIGYSNTNLRLEGSLNHEVRGYFQSYKFVEELLKRNTVFSLQESNSNSWVNHMVAEMKSFDSTLIHLRLGDYKKASDTIGLLSLRYFENALYHNNLMGTKIYVISDEVDEATQFFKKLKQTKVHVLTPPKSISSLQQLSLFSGASNIITSNSSYSWWGSWFARETANVIIPHPWYRSGDLDGHIGNELQYPGWGIENSIWRHD